MSGANTLSLVGGLLALDFANTAAGRATAVPAEHLKRAGDVIAWAIHAGCVNTRTARRARAAIAGRPDLEKRLLRRALKLREAIHGITAAIAAGYAPPETDLDRLRDFAGRAIGAAALKHVDGQYRFDFSVAPPEIALLGPVAWSAIELLEVGDFARLKQCANPDCGWLFWDGSKNNSRRWCDMATCGNVAKGRRHRARRS